MQVKIMKVGNSLGVTIPAKFVKAVGIRVGELAQVKTKLETGQVKYTFKGAKQLSLTNQL